VGTHPPSLCLAIASNGAAGQTREELVGVLGLEGVAEKKVNRRFRDLRAAVEQPAPQLELDLAAPSGVSGR
jgi:serine protease inhibitor